MKRFVILILLYSSATYSQNSLDSLLGSLNNRNLEVGLGLPGVCLTCGKQTAKPNRDSIRLHQRFAIVVSFSPDDIFKLAKKYST